VRRKFGGHQINFFIPEQVSLRVDNKIEIIHDKMKEVVLHDLRTIRNTADILLVKYDSSVLKGGGVHSEMAFATYFNVPVAVLMDGISRRDIPLWDIGCINFLSYDINKVVDYCVDFLTRINRL
jgi:hypothetical protein